MVNTVIALLSETIRVCQCVIVWGKTKIIFEFVASRLSSTMEVEISGLRGFDFLCLIQNANEVRGTSCISRNDHLSS